MEIPGGHQAVMPYLIVKDAHKFVDFAKRVFNAEMTYSRMREDGETIMHAELQIDGNTIMFCDATPQHQPQPANMFIYVDDADLTYRKAVDEGGKTVMELADMDYGLSCGVADPFGNVWWITTPK